MNEYLTGVAITLNGKWSLHLALSFNCFNVGIELYDGMVRFNLGPIAVMFKRV